MFGTNIPRSIVISTDLSITLLTKGKFFNSYISFNPLMLHLVEILLPVGQVGRGVTPGGPGNGDQEVDAAVAVVDVAPQVVRRLLLQLAQVN